MPRIRTIKPKFWDDPKLGKISRDARLVFIAMWNFADDLGVVMGEPLWLKSKIFPLDHIQVQQFERWLSELVQHGFISLFSLKDEKFYYLPNFAKHQVINRPNYDEVFVQVADLQVVLGRELSIHGTISDSSVPERKGKENKELNSFLSDSANASQTEKPKGNQAILTFPKRKEDFGKEVKQFMQSEENPNGYSREMLLKFYNYWSEPNKSKSKMRWEQEKTWDIKLRISNWDANDRAKTPPKQQNNTQPIGHIAN